MKKLQTKIFVGNTATNTAKTELIMVRIITHKKYRIYKPGKHAVPSPAIN